jgi:hypothetical protein
MNLRVAVLAATASLLGVLHLAISRTGQRFLVGDLRTADAGFDVELALQAVDDDLEVQLAHPGDHDFACRLIGLHAERRILGHQLAETLPELLLVGLGLRLDRERDDGLRKVHRLEHDRLLLVADRVAGRDAFQADRCGDVTSVDFLDLFTLVGVHLQQATKPLALLLRRVEGRRSRGHDAGIHPNECQLTDERIGHDLERQRRERCVVRRLPFHDRVRPLIRIETFDRRHIHR